MGSKYSTFDMHGTIHIYGHGNSAVIINGISYNITSLFNTALHLIMKRYRSELILIQFISVLVLIVATLIAIQFFIKRGIIEKSNQI